MSSARSCSSSLTALALVFGACAPPCDDAGAVCTVAGVPGNLGANADGQPATDTWLYFPTALAWRGDELVIDDFNNMRIRALAPDGTLRTLAGNGLHAWAQEGAAARDTPLENPVDVDVLPDGRLVVAELHTARVLVIDPDGVVDVFAGSGIEGLAGDGGPALDAEMGQVGGIAVAPDGRVAVADTDNHCVRVVEAGDIGRLAGTGLAGFVDGHAVDGGLRRPQRVRWIDGAVYVADTDNHAIRRIDLATGELVTVAGVGTPGRAGDGGPATEAQLNQPYSVRGAPDGGLLIADSGNHLVRHVTPDGTLHTLVGTGDPDYAGEGTQAEATPLDFPVDVLVGDDGDLYVADMKNAIVRRVRSLLTP
ncbi:MAG: hypothetical protein H6732_11080 [Alphaproteobacteria bacterium]|nr:hypothetical protein [Alphaproteobacteria bacterium]